jgi:hypothetical protein
MIVMCLLASVMAWYNVILAKHVADACLGIYLFIFSMVIGCYEVALRRAAILIVQNFGFLYRSVV